MEITREEYGEVLFLHVAGRLDAYWADHLSEEISAAVREGRHFVSLNLSRLTYISSAGIRVLMRFYKQLRALDGSFTVLEPSGPVREVLDVSGIEKLLAGAAADQRPAAVVPDAHGAAQDEARAVEFPAGQLQIHALDDRASMSCRIVGDPDRFSPCRYEEKDCRSVSVPARAFAIGLGALGRDFADCRPRFGEFMALGGVAAYQPAGGGDVPDYLISTGKMVSSVQVLYCLCCEGGFSHVLNFEAKPQQTVSLLEMASQCLAVTGAGAAAVVMAAETQGLVGAALRRSPAMAEAGAEPFRHPEVRDWMTFTAEPAYAHGVALVAGVISRENGAALGPIVRPLGDDPWPQGHFHGAAFSYRPLKKGRPELVETVRALFEEEMLHAVLNLINDTRPIVGAGQSEFVRGTCWTAPVANIERD